MITTGFLFAVLRAALISMLGGAVFLLILRRDKGRNPNAHRRIWFGVLLLGLCVVRLPVDVPFYEAPTIEAISQPQPQPEAVSQIVMPDEAQAQAAAEPWRRPDIPATFAPWPENATIEPIAMQDVAEPRPEVEETATSRRSIPAILLAVWALGVGLLVTRRLFLFVRLHFKLRHLQPATVPEWQRLLKQFGIAPEKIPVFWTDNSGPALVRSMSGYRILFPRSLWDELSPVHREGVLRHELAHYLGRDAIVMEAARLLAVLQWFNPISRVALRRLEEATEWRCDDFAYFNRESGPQELIETLLAVHESTESLGLYLSSFARINVITRIHRLLHIPSRKENTLMKKLILPTLFLSLLSCSLLQVNLVAKPAEKTTVPIVTTDIDEQEETPKEGTPQEEPPAENVEPAQKILMSMKATGENQFEVGLTNNSDEICLIDKNLVHGLTYHLFDSGFQRLESEEIQEEDTPDVPMDDFIEVRPGETVTAPFLPGVRVYYAVRGHASNPAPGTWPVTYYTVPCRFANLPEEYYVSVTLEYHHEMVFFISHTPSDGSKISSMIPPKSSFSFHVQGDRVSECSFDLLPQRKSDSSGSIATSAPVPISELDFETERLTQLAESMVAQTDVTLEQLRDLCKNLTLKTYRIPPVSLRVYKVLIDLCDKIISLESEEEMLKSAYDNKQRVLVLRAGAWYSEETIQAIRDFASEAEQAGFPGIGREALESIMSVKTWRLINPEIDATEEMFLEVQAELAEFYETTELHHAYIAENFADVAFQLYGRKVISAEHLQNAFETGINLYKKLPYSDEYYQEHIRDLEIKLAIALAEGKTPAITGTDMHGKAFDWNAYKGKTVLVTFTSSWFGGRGMQGVLEFAGEFSDRGPEFVTYVSLGGRHRDNYDLQEKQWLDLCIEKLDYPGTVLTQIESPEPVVEGLAYWLKVQGYRSNHPSFMLIDQDGKIVSLGDMDKTRAELIERFGQPSEEAIARGRERAKVYLTTPKPCISNFHELALAVHTYYDAHKTMPPAYTVDENGNKLHSWRTLLLPFLGHVELYRQIRLDEPWDSEHNKKIGETVVPVFQCHLSAFGPNPRPVTTYAAVVGPGCVFEENGKRTDFLDITDGVSNTLLFVERATPVPWMEPVDITFDEAVKGIGVSENGIADAHNGGSNCALCDGSTHFLSKSIDLKTLRALLTRAGGESVPFPQE